MSNHVAVSQYIGPVATCGCCGAVMPTDLVVGELCSYCRRAAGLMPDQQ